MTIHKSFYKGQQGATLIMVLFVLVLVTMVGVLAIRIALTSLNIATNSQIEQLLLQTGDTPNNQILNTTKLSNILDYSGAIGAAIDEFKIAPGKEYIFCYKPTSNQGQAITTRSVLLYQTGSVTDILAVLRFARTCLRTPNHFIHRYFVKQDLIPPLLDLLEEESSRDNMLSSSCMDVLDLIRKVSLSAGHGRS
ncbi:MAG: hypothetical protein EOO89_13060 [Pedobacter sp.]|nr:MAG: hypothetical protein EOO89_13060 [Pedobacter sp.]